MLNKIYQSPTRRYLSKNLLVIALTLFSVSCVNFSTIRNNNTSFLDGYDPEYQKVYSGRIRLIIDGIDFKGVRYKVPYLRNFLAGSAGANGLYPNKKNDRQAISTTNKDGYFAANLRDNSVTQTGVESFYYFMNGVNVNGGAVFPIKVYPDQGFYYFGDVTIELETNSIGVQKLKDVKIVNNPETMRLIAETVPEMEKLKRYNVADEVISSFKKLVKDNPQNPKKNSNNNSLGDAERKMINNF